MHSQKRELLADTKYSFIVCDVCGSKVSAWCDIIKGRTQRKLFETSGWKKCPDSVDLCKKYYINEENSKVISMNSSEIHGDDGLCTIIGTTPLSYNKVTSWNIKILNSKVMGMVFTLVLLPLM